MISYLIKSACCGLLFLLIYRFILQREKMYAFNRLYLLFSILFSLLVPFLSFQVNQQTPDVLENIYLPAILPITQEQSPIVTTAPVPAPATLSLTLIALIVYVLVTLVLLVRFIRNLFRIRQAIAGNQVLHYHEAWLILVNNDIPAHSFLQYVFMSRADYNDPNTRHSLLTHELSHVRQRHSWDILFIELLQVFYWFNPTYIFYKKAIQLNHELQADDTVIKIHGDIPGYQHLLLDKIQHQHIIRLTSSFNYFITKKRLTMMTKSSNRTRMTCLQLALLPLFLCAIFLFSGRTYAQDKKTSEKKARTTTGSEKQEQDTTVPKIVSFSLPVGPGASPEQLDEYKAIIGKTVDNSGKPTKYKFSTEEKNRIKTLFSAMNKEQRRQLPMIMFVKPSPKKSPTAADLQRWSDPNMYGVWIGSKRTNNTELANYKPEDFVLFYESRLAKNARNYGKHYFQVSLYTLQQYDAMYKDGEESVVLLKAYTGKPRPKTK
jgi:beta-lactamase regulating signal transducer with metallopeptidase domain